MQPVQATTSITVDNETFAVADLSPEIQQMVQYLDQWRQDEVDQAAELLKTRAALRDIQNTLLQQFQADQEAAAREEAAEQDAESTPAAVPAE